MIIQLKTTTLQRWRPRSLVQLGATAIPPKDSISNENNESISSDLIASSSSSSTNEALEQYVEQPIKGSRFQKLKKRLFPPKEDDGLTTRQRLSKMGLSVLLSYGFVSNISTSITAALSWFLFSKRTGLSPLAPNQWKPYVGVYAGLYLMLNALRPARVALAVGMSRYFDSTIQLYQNKFNVSKRTAIAITVFCFNVVGTLSMMTGGILLASLLSGVPIF